MANKSRRKSRKENQYLNKKIESLIKKIEKNDYRIKEYFNDYNIGEIEIKWSEDKKWYIIYKDDVVYKMEDKISWYIVDYLKEMKENKILLDKLLNCDNYWRLSMNNRMNFNDEVTRLTNLLKGFYLDHCIYSKENPDYYELLSFWHEKRPYGSKCIEQSIAFNLGWDKDRLLCHVDLPQYVKNEAMKVHSAVLKKLKENEYMYIDKSE